MIEDPRMGGVLYKTMYQDGSNRGRELVKRKLEAVLERGSFLGSNEFLFILSALWNMECLMEFCYQIRFCSRHFVSHVYKLKVTPPNVLSGGVFAKLLAYKIYV